MCGGGEERVERQERGAAYRSILIYVYMYIGQTRVTCITNGASGGDIIETCCVYGRSFLREGTNE